MTPHQSDHERPRRSTSRRTFLRATVAVAVTGFGAGCVDDGDTDPTGTGTGTGAPSVDEWLADTGNYESIEDLTDRSSVTIEVGARGNSGSNAFAPPAVEIAPGTSVTWDWVDGYHNVVDSEGTFDSGGAERNGTFEYAFETPGTYRYYCDPHSSIGMKGAVVVEGDDGESNGRLHRGVRDD